GNRAADGAAVGPARRAFDPVRDGGRLPCCAACQGEVRPAGCPSLPGQHRGRTTVPAGDRPYGDEAAGRSEAGRGGRPTGKGAAGAPGSLRPSATARGSSSPLPVSAVSTISPEPRGEKKGIERPRSLSSESRLRDRTGRGGVRGPGAAARADGAGRLPAAAAQRPRGRGLLPGDVPRARPQGPHDRRAGVAGPLALRGGVPHRGPGPASRPTAGGPNDDGSPYIPVLLPDED